MLMMVVKRKTTLALVIPLLLCWLQGNTQSDDPEQPTEASPVLIHEIPINPNDVPEMMVSSSIPTASPSPLPERCAPHRIFGISWSPDRIHMAVGINSGLGRINHRTLPDCPYSGAVQIFDMSGDKPKLMHTLTDATDRVRDVAYNHDGTQLAASVGNKVLVYDASDFTFAPTRLADFSGVVTIAYNYNSTQLATGDELTFEDGGRLPKIRIYDGKNPVSGSDNFIQNAEQQSAKFNKIVYKPIDTQLAAMIGKEVWLYDVMYPISLSRFRILEDSEQFLQSIIYNHNGTQLATGDALGTVRIYDGTNPISGTFQRLTDATGSIDSIDYNPNDTRLAVGGEDNRVRIYDGINPTLPLIHTLTDATDDVRKVAYDHTGGLLAVGGDDGWLRIYQVVVPDSPTPSPVPSPVTPTQTQDGSSSGSVTTALSLTAFMAVFWAMVLP